MEKFEEIAFDTTNWPFHSRLEINLRVGGVITDCQSFCVI